MFENKVKTSGKYRPTGLGILMRVVSDWMSHKKIKGDYF